MTTVLGVVGENELTTGQLLTRGAAGDEAAWVELTDRLLPAVWAVVRSFGFNREQSEDLAQTVWLRLMDHCQSIRNPEAVAGWVKSTARNEAVAMVRLSGRETPTEVFDLRESPLGRPEDHVEADETQRLLWEAFEALSEECRSILRLSAAKMTYADIGAALDMPVGSIGPKRQRCLAHLRNSRAGRQIVEDA